VGKEGYEKFCSELGKMVPVKDLGPLEWYSGCFYEREKELGRLTISQENYALELVAEYGIECLACCRYCSETWRVSC